MKIHSNQRSENLGMTLTQVAAQTKGLPEGHPLRIRTGLVERAGEAAHKRTKTDLQFGPMSSNSIENQKSTRVFHPVQNMLRKRKIYTWHYLANEPLTSIVKQARKT